MIADMASLPVADVVKRLLSIIKRPGPGPLSTDPWDDGKHTGRGTGPRPDSDNPDE